MIALNLGLIVVSVGMYCLAFLTGILPRALRSRKAMCIAAALIIGGIATLDYLNANSMLPTHFSSWLTAVVVGLLAGLKTLTSELQRVRR